jgi:hypothetical protein
LWALLVGVAVAWTLLVLFALLAAHVVLRLAARLGLALLVLAALALLLLLVSHWENAPAARRFANNGRRRCPFR